MVFTWKAAQKGILHRMCVSNDDLATAKAQAARLHSDDSASEDEPDERASEHAPRPADPPEPLLHARRRPQSSQGSTGAGTPRASRASSAADATRQNSVSEGSPVPRARTFLTE